MKTERFLRWGQRIATWSIFAITAVALTHDHHNPTEVWYWNHVAVVVVLGFVIINNERLARLDARTMEQERWRLASESTDPVTALAQMDYIRSLSPMALRRLEKWLKAGSDPETAPPEAHVLWELAKPPIEQPHHQQ